MQRRDPAAAAFIALGAAFGLAWLLHIGLREAFGVFVSALPASVSDRAGALLSFGLFEALPAIVLAVCLWRLAPLLANDGSVVVAGLSSGLLFGGARLGLDVISARLSAGAASVFMSLRQWSLWVAPLVLAALVFVIWRRSRGRGAAHRASDPAAGGA